MQGALEALLVLLLLTCLALLGSSRLTAYIRIVAVQGLLLGGLTLAVHARTMSLDVVVLALGSTIVKSLVFPRLLTRAVREADVRTAVEPSLGYGASLAIATGLLATALWLGWRLPLPHPVASPLVVPVSLFMACIGLLLITSCKQALSQVVGYLVLENGIYAFGVALLVRSPIWVELAILLDLLVAILVMGATLFNINRDLDHIDTSRLSVLKD